MCTTKICVTCKIEKSLDEFSIRTDTNKIRNTCKKCCNEKVKRWKKNNKDKVIEQDRKYRKTENRKNYLKQYNIENIEKLRERNRKHSKTEKAKETEKRYQQTEKRQQYLKKYFEEHKEQRRQITRIWFKTEKGKACSKASCGKRRAIQRVSNITTKDILELQKTAKTCYWCGCNLKGKSVHIDHYVPLSKGGEHTLENLVISCSKCNLSKNAKDPIDFANSIGKLF